MYNLDSVCEKYVNESAGLLPNKFPKPVYLLIEASRYSKDQSFLKNTMILYLINLFWANSSSSK